MRKKIFRHMLLVALVVLVVTGGLFITALYGYFEKQEQGRMTAYLRAVDETELDPERYETLWQAAGYRFTIIDPDGKVLYDTQADPAKMENHSEREEVVLAQMQGVGQSSRLSSTLAHKTLYNSRLMPGRQVWRLAEDQRSIMSLVMGMIQPVLIIIVVALIICGILARHLAKILIKPLEGMDLEHPLDNKAYEELSPMLVKLHGQQLDLEEKRRELEDQRRSFAMVSDRMTEGLILLDDKGRILSMNPAARRLLHTDETAVNRHLIEIYRQMAFQKSLEKALQGETVELTLEEDGNMYAWRMTPVLGDRGEQKGTVILAVDITERMEAEERRREFAANVSHELKTPLHSILGAAELLEQRLVKPADVPDFVHRIHEEAMRLVSMIDDILELSRLDEQATVPIEEVDLYTLAQEAVHTLEAMAVEKDVTLTVTGEHVAVEGVRPWLYEIIHNLLDNAIKYNVSGGSVDIVLDRQADTAVLVVKDTGRGIPAADQSRIFERFYRVDKSHGRDTGGSGLGMAIIKRAVAYHHGHVDLDSLEGCGTTMTVTLPLHWQE